MQTPTVRMHLEIARSDRFALDADPAGVRFEQTADHLDGGGLAGAVGTQQAEDLALLHRQADILHGFQVAEGFAEVADFKAGIVQGMPIL